MKRPDVDDMIIVTAFGLTVATMIAIRIYLFLKG